MIIINNITVAKFNKEFRLLIHSNEKEILTNVKRRIKRFNKSSHKNSFVCRKPLEGTFVVSLEGSEQKLM